MCCMAQGNLRGDAARGQRRPGPEKCKAAQGGGLVLRPSVDSKVPTLTHLGTHALSRISLILLFPASCYLAQWNSTQIFRYGKGTKLWGWSEGKAVQSFPAWPIPSKRISLHGSSFACFISISRPWCFYGLLVDRVLLYFSIRTRRLP